MPAYERRSWGSGNAVMTTITAQLDAGVTTTFSITAATRWPDGSEGPFLVAIEPTTDLTSPSSGFEIIECATRTGTSCDITSRGQGGTSDATHASGSRAWVVSTTRDFDEANYWVAELAAAINTAGDIPVADANNSLTTLAKGAASTVLGVSSGGTLGYATVATAQIADNAVTNVKMADNSVDSAEIVAGAIDTAHIGDDQVTAAKIADGAIDAAAKFGSGVVDATAIATDAVGSAEIAADAVGISEAAGAVLSDFVDFSRTGTLTTGTGTMRRRFPVAVTLKHTRLSVGTAPTGAAIIVDVHKNGTTVYTTQANRPTIDVSTNTENDTDTPDVTAIAAGDYLTVDIDQVGSTVAGADLVVTIYYELA